MFPPGRLGKNFQHHGKNIQHHECIQPSPKPEQMNFFRPDKRFPRIHDDWMRFEPTPGEVNEIMDMQPPQLIKDV